VDSLAAEAKAQRLGVLPFEIGNRSLHRVPVLIQRGHELNHAACGVQKRCLEALLERSHLDDVVFPEGIEVAEARDARGLHQLGQKGRERLAPACDRKMRWYAP
jgi:hypothetical protein